MCDCYRFNVNSVSLFDYSLMKTEGQEACGSYTSAGPSLHTICIFIFCFSEDVCNSVQLSQIFDYIVYFNAQLSATHTSPPVCRNVDLTSGSLLSLVNCFSENEKLLLCFSLCFC